MCKRPLESFEGLYSDVVKTEVLNRIIQYVADIGNVFFFEDTFGIKHFLTSCETDGSIIITNFTDN